MFVHLYFSTIPTILTFLFKFCLFRCSLLTAMSISRREILRKKKRKGPKMKKSWEIMGGQWEVMWGLWGSWEVREGSWEVSGGSWEVSEWSWEVSGRLPTAMSICRSEIFRRKNKNTKCPTDAQCHRHCRRDPRNTKDWEVLQVLSSEFGKKFLRKLKSFLPKSKKTEKLKTYRTSMQSFVILGSLLQWRWQWASIGHFVFLFSPHWLHASKNASKVSAAANIKCWPFDYLW